MKETTVAVQTLPDKDWKQVELGISAMVDDVVAGLPRNEHGARLLMVAVRRHYIHPGAITTKQEYRPDPWPHLDALVEAARQTHGYKVVACRVAQYLNEIPGLYTSKIAEEPSLAVQGKSEWFDRYFVGPLVGEGVRRRLLGNWVDDGFAEEATALIRRLVEQEGLRFRFWWTITNLRIDSQGDVDLGPGVRLRRLTVDEKADFASDLADLGFGPTLQELQRLDWAFEVDADGGENKLLPGQPSNDAFDGARRKLDALLGVLGLVGPGMVLVRWRDHDPLQWSQQHWIPGLAIRPQKAVNAPPFVEADALELTAEDLDRLRHLWQEVQSADAADADLDAVITRHTRACRQIHPLDRARDLISCLERAFLSRAEKQGKGQKLALRVSSLLYEPGEERRQARKYLEDTYEYRNGDLHDAEAPPEQELKRLAAIARDAVTCIVGLTVQRQVRLAALRDDLARFVNTSHAGEARYGG